MQLFKPLYGDVKTLRQQDLHILKFVKGNVKTQENNQTLEDLHLTTYHEIRQGRDRLHTFKNKDNERTEFSFLGVVEPSRQQMQSIYCRRQLGPVSRRSSRWLVQVWQQSRSTSGVKCKLQRGLLDARKRERKEQDWMLIRRIFLQSLTADTSITKAIGPDKRSESH